MISGLYDSKMNNGKPVWDFAYSVWVYGLPERKVDPDDANGFAVVEAPPSQAEPGR